MGEGGGGFGGGREGSLNTCEYGMYFTRFFFREFLLIGKNENKF